MVPRAIINLTTLSKDMIGHFQIYLKTNVVPHKVNHQLTWLVKVALTFITNFSVQMTMTSRWNIMVFLRLISKRNFKQNTPIRKISTMRIFFGYPMETWSPIWNFHHFTIINPMITHLSLNWRILTSASPTCIGEWGISISNISLNIPLTDRDLILKCKLLTKIITKMASLLKSGIPRRSKKTDSLIKRWAFCSLLTIIMLNFRKRNGK